jgi:hypothetical protein
MVNVISYIEDRNDERRYSFHLGPWKLSSSGYGSVSRRYGLQLSCILDFKWYTFLQFLGILVYEIAITCLVGLCFGIDNP